MKRSVALHRSATVARWLTAASLAAALLPMGKPTARAATALPSTYWDPGHSGTSPGSGGSGVWDVTTANWVSTSGSDDVPYPSANGRAILAGTAGTVSLNASGVSGAYLELDTAGYVVQDAPGTSYALSLSSGVSAGNATGTVTVSVPLNLTNPNPSGGLSSNGGTLAVTGNLTASGTLNIFGGTVVLSGNNAIAGPTNVAGTLQLAGTGANQPLGGTTRVYVNQSTLLYGASNQVPAGTPVTIYSGNGGGGTFSVNGNSQSLAARLGVLTVTNGGALDFGAGLSTGSVLAFANSSGAAWSGTLNVYDYRGTPGTGGGVDQLYFGSDTAGLTTAQLGQINFYSGGAGSALLGTGIILGDGEVTYSPVPEPATWLGGAGLLGATGLLLRRRSRRAA